LKSKKIIAGICIAVLAALYVASATLFSASLRANTATPEAGAAFYFGRTILIQITTLTLTVYLCVRLFGDFRRKSFGLVTSIMIRTLAAAVIYAVTLFLGSMAFESLDKIIFRLLGQ
jgi:hypothetical protein